MEDKRINYVNYNIKELFKHAKKYVKVIPIKAIKNPFNDIMYIDTMEGVMKLEKNAYLLIGIKGELYPCDKEIFEESYKEQNEK